MRRTNLPATFQRGLLHVPLDLCVHVPLHEVLLPDACPVLILVHAFCLSRTPLLDVSKLAGQHGLRASVSCCMCMHSVGGHHAYDM